MDWSYGAKLFISAARNAAHWNQPDKVAELGTWVRMVRNGTSNVALRPDTERPR
jgi:hypothetical protein